MINNKITFPLRTLATGLAVAVVLALSACGGGLDPVATMPAPTLSGTAAVGYPIIGALVHVTCASGAPIVSQPTTATGAWIVSLTGQIFPCAAEVSGGTINGATSTTAYHSVATAPGVLNVTPLTDLITAILAKSATLSEWFSGLSLAAFSQVNAAAINNALDLLQAQLALAQLGSSINPMTTVFVPAPGNVMDDTLTALANALLNASLTHASLLAQAGSGTGFTAPIGLATKIAVAYTGTTSGALAGGTPQPVAIANTTTGVSTNGTPSIVVTNCSNAYGATNYMGCRANAIANFSTVSLVDATDGQTCTASYSNGSLIVTKGALTFLTILNGEFVDSLTTVVIGAAQSVSTLTGYFSGYRAAATGIYVATSTVTWNVAGTLNKIQGQAVSTGYSSQLSCTQP